MLPRRLLPVAFSVATALMVAVPQARTPGQDTLPSGRELVNRHVRAIGGEGAFRAVSSIRARGRFEIQAQGITGEVEILSARPAKLLSRVTVPGLGRIENAFNGSVGWSISPLTGPELLSGRQLSELAEDAIFDSQLHEPSRVRELTTTARTEFDGKPAYRVKVVMVSGNEQLEYYDVESGTLIGSEASRATPQGVVPMVNVLRDYRRFGALMQPTTFIQRALGFEQRLTLAAYDYDVVADAAFDPPAEIKALITR